MRVDAQQMELTDMHGCIASAKNIRLIPVALIIESPPGLSAMINSCQITKKIILRSRVVGQLAWLITKIHGWFDSPLRYKNNKVVDIFCYLNTNDHKSSHIISFIGNLFKIPLNRRTLCYSSMEPLLVSKGGF